MRSVFRNRVVLAALTLMAGACVENSDPTPSLTSPNAGDRVPVGDGSVRATSNSPAGAFRTTPTANEDVITISLGEEVLVNGARFVAADPGDELKVEIEWGDGERAVIGCGPCRLSHVYRRPGTYSLTATIHNRRLVDRGSVTQVFRVSVQDPHASPPADCSIRPEGDIWDGFLNPATGIEMCRCRSNGRELPYSLPGGFSSQCAGNRGEAEWGSLCFCSGDR
jgi:hypothetical protein